MYELDHQVQDWCQFHRPKYKSRKLQEFGTENNNSRHASRRHCQEPLTLWHPSESLAKRSVGVILNHNRASVLTPSRQNFGPTSRPLGWKGTGRIRSKSTVARLPEPNETGESSSLDSTFQPALLYQGSWPTMGSPKRRQDSIPRVQYQEPY